MYEIFYGLRAEPFRLSPDHRFCYEHSAYAKARAYMAYALKRAEGFVMITGRPGTGKTTLIGELVDSLADENVTTANLVCTQLEADDLLKTVAYSFGVGSAGVDKAELLQRITVLLNRWHREKRRALLVVDEAQDLSISAMEELRLLTNIQVGGQPLLQIFLLGQPELRDLILSPQLEQVHQRIVAASHLEGLAVDETEAYVVHRLQVVGWRGDPAVDRRIFPLIHKFSEGVPRRINLICSRLFLLGCVEERHEIKADDVRVVIAELQAESLAAGSAFSDEEFYLDGAPDWVAVPERDAAPEVDAATLHLRAVSNDSFTPAAPPNVETLAPVTPLKQPEPEPEPEPEAEPAREDLLAKAQAAVQPAPQPADVAAPGSEFVAEDTGVPAIAPDAAAVEAPDSGTPADMPLRMAAPGARAVAPPSLPLPRLFLILCIVVALGVSLLFFLELYVGRDDDWDEVLAGEVVPAAPPVEAATEEPIEELGILPSEQWERDGKLIDWERDVEQQGAGADAQDSVAAPASDQVSDVAEADTAGEIATVATARDDARTPTAQEEVVGAASAIATGPVDATTAVVDEVAPPAAAPSVEVSAEESEQLLALLNEEAAAETYSVSFAFDSIALNREARDILAQAIDKLLAEPGYRAEIIGFSDYQGDEAYNLQLSIERARAVRDYFSEAGVPPQRLRVSGRGAQSEQGSAGINQRRQLRVVQIRLLDGLN